MLVNNDKLIGVKLSSVHCFELCLVVLFNSFTPRIISLKFGLLIGEQCLVIFFILLPSKILIVVFDY